MAKAEDTHIAVTIKRGYGEWRVTYQDGVPVTLEAWETDDRTGEPIAHHVIRRQQLHVDYPKD